ncbi:hypothetical protein I6M25_21855, partial [Shewanella algae]|nr:hypothetical protein [Shewanella algae]
HQVSASMAKSGSWARGVSAAVFLGELYGAGNGLHQAPCFAASAMALSTISQRSIKFFV